MKKKIIMLTFLIVVNFIFTGCNVSKQQSAMDKVIFDLRKTAELYSYTTEAVSKGSIVITKNFTSMFSFSSAGEADNSGNANKTDKTGNSNNADDSVPILVKTFAKTDKKFNLFKKGEKGIIQIDMKNNIFAGNIDKTIELKGIVSDVKNIDSSTQQVTVKIPGDYDETVVNTRTRATFKVITTEKENLLRVPLKALKYYDKKAVLGVIKNDVREDREITTGFIGDDYAQVLSGVSDGELIVTGLYTNK